MRAWGKRDPHVDPWTIGREPGAPKQWAATDLRAWSSGQRYTAALALAFSLIVVTTSRGPVSGADDFLDGIGDGSAVEVADARAEARRAAGPSLTVGSSQATTAPAAAFPEPVAPEPAPAFPEPAAASPAEEPSPEATPPPPPPSSSPSPPPSSPPADEPDESPLGELPVPLPLP